MQTRTDSRPSHRPAERSVRPTAAGSRFSRRRSSRPGRPPGAASPPRRRTPRSPAMHGPETVAPDTTFDVRGITRVEGEGSLRIRVHDGVVTEAHLEIFEAPRYFERLVVGRTPDEVIDIVARICGIC